MSTATSATPAGPAPASSPSNRLMSLDALRGFDMFWIIGAEGLVEGLRAVSDVGPLKILGDQLEHKAWAGFAFEDLIFPLFVFMAGISVVFSLTKTIEREGQGAATRRVLQRWLLMWVLGMFYYGGFATPFEKIRVLGVLQRIAFAYLGAGLCFIWFKPRGLIAACAGLLLGYWAIMSFVPIRDINLSRESLKTLHAAAGTTNTMALYQATTNRVTGKLDEGLNVANHFDFLYLPGRKWDGAFDPEGALSTFPAVATCLLGVFAGLLLRSGVPEQRKVLWLLAAGTGSVALGWLWGMHFTVIKKIWTSSYVLVAAGYSCWLLAFFYQVVEIWKFHTWAQPFVWVGTNSIAIYLAHNLIDFEKIAQRFAGGDLNHYFGIYGRLVVELVNLGLVFGFVRFLYKRKIFLRL